MKTTRGPIGWHDAGLYLIAPGAHGWRMRAHRGAAEEATSAAHSVGREVRLAAAPCAVHRLRLAHRARGPDAGVAVQQRVHHRHAMSCAEGGAPSLKIGKSDPASSRRARCRVRAIVSASRMSWPRPARQNVGADVIYGDEGPVSKTFLKTDATLCPPPRRARGRERRRRVLRAPGPGPTGGGGLGAPRSPGRATPSRCTTAAPRDGAGVAERSSGHRASSKRRGSTRRAGGGGRLA